MAPTAQPVKGSEVGAESVYYWNGGVNVVSDMRGLSKLLREGDKLRRQVKPDQIGASLARMCPVGANE